MISIDSTGAAARRRRAGTVVGVLGGLNVVAGLLVTIAGGGGVVGLLALVAGVVLGGLAWWLRQGSRSAAMIATGLLGLLVAFQVFVLVAAPDVISVVRLAITLLILAIVARAVPAH